MIKQFNEVNGRYIAPVEGQTRYGYGISENEDFLDVSEIIKKRDYRGCVITFYDWTTGEVYTPFKLRKNTAYASPLYSDGYIYFLGYAADKNTVTLYRCIPGEITERVKAFNSDDLDLYNLKLIGEDVHIISQDDKFICYYPERFSFDLKPEETVCLISEDRVYIEAWTEEGWDSENDCATENYRFYNRLIVKDFNGNTLSEKQGSINQAPDGTWWIS